MPPVLTRQFLGGGVGRRPGCHRGGVRPGRPACGSGGPRSVVFEVEGAVVPPSDGGAGEVPPVATPLRVRRDNRANDTRNDRGCRSCCHPYTSTRPSYVGTITRPFATTGTLNLLNEN